jgi:hypothetical protein
LATTAGGEHGQRPGNEHGRDKFWPDHRTRSLPDAKWTAWAIWSAISLGAALFAVFVAGADTGLLLGWVVGVIVAAMPMMFGRK